MGSSYLQTSCRAIEGGRCGLTLLLGEAYCVTILIYILNWLHFPIYKLCTNLTLKENPFFWRAIRGQKSFPEALNFKACA